jgi:hypothetical protein
MTLPTICHLMLITKPQLRISVGPISRKEEGNNGIEHLVQVFSLAYDKTAALNQTDDDRLPNIFLPRIDGGK